MVKENIFKTYDIRGVYEKEIDEDTVYKIGRSFVSFLEKENPSVALGRDGRNSSPLLAKRLKEGLIDSGARVIDTGISNTPLLNFSVIKGGFDGGVMVTASHNPAEFNGLKLVRNNSLPVYGEDIQKIKEIVLKEKFKSKKGIEEKKSFLSEYLDYLFPLGERLQDLKVVIDCGNGVGALTAKPFFCETRIEPVFLCEEIDGSFPCHLPDPYDTESLSLIQKEVVEKGADIGVLFDGDADRCILINEKGELISTDTILSLLASEELKNQPGETIYHDLRFSMATTEEIKKAGGNPVMMRVGNPFYKERIINEGGLMGAELSGHIMFRENFGIDDGLFAALKVLNILNQKKEKLSKIVARFERYFQTREINLKVKDKEKTLAKVKEAFKEGESVNLDGVYVRYNDWWFSLRKSNTEDLVRLRLEAQSEKLLIEKKDELIALIKS